VHGQPPSPFLPFFSALIFFNIFLLSMHFFSFRSVVSGVGPDSSDAILDRDYIGVWL
jgi:hypothetical protein